MPASPPTRTRLPHPPCVAVRRSRRRASSIRHKVIRKSELKEKHPEERHILISPLPLVPVGKCMAGASVLTDIIIGKFMYHLPFYRLIQQYRESGITISDSTMGGWYEDRKSVV